MFYLKRNLPTLERGVRLLLGVYTAIVTLMAAPTLMWTVLGITTALTLGGTALVGFCPACAMLGRKPIAKARDART